jgi:hypothetical protein
MPESVRRARLWAEASGDGAAFRRRIKRRILRMVKPSSLFARSRESNI